MTEHSKPASGQAQQRRLRPYLWLIRVIGVIVPRRLRADWRQEWEAELCYREALLADWDRLDWKTKFDLARRSLGAFWDALLLQPSRLEDEMFRDLRFGLRLVELLQTMPGVEAAAVTTSPPTGGAFMNVTFLIAGRPEPSSDETQRAFLTLVSPDYFRVIGNPLKAGRLFSDNDNESSPPVAIINETMARSYFAGADPVGQRIAFMGEADTQLEVVGVTADVKQFGLDVENKPTFYRPYRQQEGGSMSLVVATSGDPASMITALRSRILEADKFTAITRVRTLNELVSDSVAQPRFYMLLLAIFAGVALTLAALGIYGVVAYSVSQRTHEIGIRVALGAEASRILRLVVGRGLMLILAGVGIGLAGAFALTRLMQGLLFEVRATDPSVFAVIALLLIAVALAACLVPARRRRRLIPWLRCATNENSTLEGYPCKSVESVSSVVYASPAQRGAFWMRSGCNN